MISTARLRGCKRLFYQRFGWLMMNAMNQTQPLRRQNTQSEKTHSQPSLKAGQQWNQADTAEFMHTSYGTLAVKPLPRKRSASPSGYNSGQSECSAAWQRTCFGSRGSKVRILVLRPIIADVAQSVAHILGKDEVAGSIPAISTRRKCYGKR